MNEFFLGSDLHPVEGRSGILIRQLCGEVQAIAKALQLQLVLGQAKVIDLNGAEGEGALRGVADEVAVLIEVECIAEVAAAQVERLADEHLLKLGFTDAGLCVRWGWLFLRGFGNCLNRCGRGWLRTRSRSSFRRKGGVGAFGWRRSGRGRIRSIWRCGGLGGCGWRRSGAGRRWFSGLLS